MTIPVLQRHPPITRPAARLSPLFLALLALAVMIGSASALPGPTSGSLLLSNPQPGAPPVEAPRLRTDITVDVSGPTARAVVTQAFRNTTDRWVEGTYVYPLPEDAAVDAMTLVVGERVIVADVRERAVAKRIYEAAKHAGQSAALTEQERPNVFTNTVANIGPGETVLVQIVYQQAVPVADGRRSLRIPLVVAPRYSPAPALSGPSVAAAMDRTARSGDHPADPVPDRARIAPPVLDPSAAAPVNPVAVTVRLQAGFPVGSVESGTHAVHVEASGPATRRITLAEGVVPADRDFELTWSPVPGVVPRLGLFREEIGGETYLLATVNPPEATGPRPPRDITFVVDNSGSMAGASMRQAKAGVLAGLARLTPRDRVNVIRFDDTWDALFPEPAPASPETLRAAEAFVGALEARGGTEMLAPMKAALADPHPDEADRVRQVVFLTDGAVGDEERIFAAIHAGLGRTRLFMVGIGSAPNGHLMRHAAEIGRGSFTAILSGDQVAERSRELYARLENPAVTDLAAALSEPGAAVTPDPLPDVFRGLPVAFGARLAHAEGTFTVSGRVGGRPWSETLPLADARPGAGISKVWARSRIGEAEAARITGRMTPGDADAAILDLALTHKLVTRLTSLIAVDATPRRAPGTSLSAADLPVNLPAGWDFASVFGEPSPGVRPLQPGTPDAALVSISGEARGVVLPQTGAGVALRLYLGVALAGLGLLVGLMSRLFARARAGVAR